MATYYEPDEGTGGYKVTLPNGTRVPMMLSEDQLRKVGAMPVQDHGPDERTAMAPAGHVAPGPRAVSGPVTATGGGLSGRQEARDAGSTDWVDPKSPEIQAQLKANEAAAASQGDIAMPGRSLAPKPTGEDATPAAAAVQTRPVQPFQSLDDKALAYIQASRQWHPGRNPGYVPRSRSVSIDGAPSQERVNQIAAAQGKEMDATRAMENADVALANNEAARANLQTEEKLRAIEEMRQRQQVVGSEVRRRMSEVDARRQELRNAPAPRSTGLFLNTGALGMIGGALAVFMGSLGQQLTGSGENLGIKGIEDGIERDIQAQREKLAKMGDDYDNAKGALAEYTRIHGDPVMGEKELRAAQIDYVMSKGDALAARTKSQQVSAQWQAKRAQLEAQQARELAELEAMQTGKVQEQYAYDPGRSGGWVRPGLGEGIKALKQYKEGAEAYADATGMAKPDPEKALYMGGNFVGNAASGPEGEKIRSELSEVEEFDAIMGDLLYMQKNWSKWNPEQRAKALATNTTAKLRKKGPAMDAMGVLAGRDLEMIEETIPKDPNAMIAPGAAAMLEQTRAIARRKMDIRVRNQGIQVTTLPWSNTARAD